MTDENDIGGSPPCFACEMDGTYAGFLPPAELAAALTRLLRLAEEGPEPARWRTALTAALRRLPEPAPAGAEAKASDLAGAVRALLPRIADDRLHAALKALVEA